ncbi:xanthine dehydrogenase family protein molybdopterin-binding subunit [Rhodoplanes sp. Z2-YC6860]|uniref:xanthine dehydrogenase family protein molybdopterin-binding subunit n=1 Tax=Rhodoplanes sp. Z2-YC6860 TaxID=674703 RepID=UPI00078BC06F|nr:xanthine dehydrogenase family protein molybdopterin-binding subunit [Rhodoplanes sp. Z2-YC6860]AMN45311.1 carbon monoxide dehydrogenase [Rhodoplanes sp. Z2-YC6860]
MLRVEDPKFLRGQGCFVADISLPGELHCVLVRSPHAHARIRRIDKTAAAASAGVVAVFSGADLAQDKVGPMAPLWAIATSDGKPMAEPPRWALARDVVRHVGEAVAAVIAETRAQAQDAADLLDVDYEQLHSVIDGRAAMEAGAPQLHEMAPDNVCFRFARGDTAAVTKAFANAPHTVGLDLVNGRLIGAAIEPRAVLADGGAGKLTLYCSTQVPHHIRRNVTEQLRLPQTAIRLIAPDVGGGFGYKGKHYPEETIIAWAALRLRRPVKWVASRSECFLSDYQGRGHQTRAELAFDGDGHFLALRVDTVANIGAYVSTFGAGIPSAIYCALLAGVYRTPAIMVQSTGVFTNTVPTDAYRGAGRPEACYVLERLADEAARKLGMDRAEIRRRNLVPNEAMPYKTPIGPTYDCGDFPKVFARLTEIAGYKGFAKRQAAAARTPKRRGFGFACYVESSGVAPSRFAAALGARVGFFEAASIRVQADGSVQALLGTHNHGQGHATTFAQIIASRLGVPMASVEIIEGDTDQVPYGSGTFGSRSIAVGGSALDRAAEKIIDKGKKIAAHLLEASAADITFGEGNFTVAGTDRRVTLREVARVAHHPTSYPADMELGLQDSAVYDPSSFAWSNGVHACEVEVDCDTGVVSVVNYWAVDDIGTVINPMIVDGQITGGIAQGLGQATREHCVYDPANGQLLSGSFMDYAVPRANDMPDIVSELDESQPCTHNPLGAKGCGEAGSIGAPAAIVGAVLDALRPLGVTDIEMPLTPERVWNAIRAAVRG